MLSWVQHEKKVFNLGARIKDGDSDCKLYYFSHLVAAVTIGFKGGDSAVLIM